MTLEADAEPAQPSRGVNIRGRQVKLPWLVVPIICMVIASNIGGYGAPSFAKHHPLVLIMLNSQNRFLLLASAGLTFWPFFIVGTLRLLLPDPFFFALGRGWGDRGLAWARKQAGVKETVQIFEKLFHSARYPAVIIAPNNFICPMAGADGMSPKIFGALDVVGTMGRVVLLWWLGARFQRPITATVNWLSRYQWRIIIAGVIIVALQVLFRGKNPLQTNLDEFDDTTEAPEARSVPKAP